MSNLGYGNTLCLCSRNFYDIQMNLLLTILLRKKICVYMTLYLMAKLLLLYLKYRGCWKSNATVSVRSEKSVRSLRSLLKEEALRSQLWFYLCLWGKLKTDSKNTRLNSFQGWRVTLKCFFLQSTTRRLGYVLTWIPSLNICQKEEDENCASFIHFTHLIFIFIINSS